MAKYRHDCDPADKITVSSTSTVIYLDTVYYSGDREVCVRLTMEQARQLRNDLTNHLDRVAIPTPIEP